MSDDRFAAARAVADAVLFEGYVLYPYRASARKNQVRWQFGVLVPPDAAAVAAERSALRTECVVDPGQEAALTIRVRCLQVQRRDVRDADGRPVESLDVDGVPWVSWDEAVEREIEVGPVPVLPLGAVARDVPFELPGGEDVEPLGAGQAVRRREAVEGVVRLRAEWAAGAGALEKVTVSVANTTSLSGPPASRDDALPRSLVAVHLLLGLDDAEFVSLLDPPFHAREAVAGCANDGLFPVLAGPDGGADVVLASPIILYDHPEIAPESTGDLYDATEIDEILALRVLALTDDEKAAARGTDPRAAAVIDRWDDDVPPEVWARLHGAVRSVAPIAEEVAALPWWEPGADASVDPATDTITVAGVEVGAGTRVRLRPSRRADAHDIFLAGRDATVAGVFRDVDGASHVAVTLEDDPAAEAFAWQGRYLYFQPDELEVVG